MPAEKIQETTLPGQGEPPYLRIGWLRDGEGVQVATINPNSPFEWPETADSSGGPFDGWWITLSRAQINDAIRILRRARDQAYGRDE